MTNQFASPNHLYNVAEREVIVRSISQSGAGGVCTSVTLAVAADTGDPKKPFVRLHCTQSLALSYSPLSHDDFDWITNYRGQKWNQALRRSALQKPVACLQVLGDRTRLLDPHV